MWPSLCVAPARCQQHPHTLVPHWAQWQGTKRCQDTREGTRGVVRTGLVGKGCLAVQAPGWDSWGHRESCQYQNDHGTPQPCPKIESFTLIATLHRDMQGQAMLAGAPAVAFALPELAPGRVPMSGAIPWGLQCLCAAATAVASWSQVPVPVHIPAELRERQGEEDASGDPSLRIAAGSIVPREPSSRVFAVRFPAVCKRGCSMSLQCSRPERMAAGTRGGDCPLQPGHTGGQELGPQPQGARSEGVGGLR